MAADLPRLTNAVGAMVAAAVAPSAERVAVARRQIDVGRKERVRQIVRKHLRTPTFGPMILCRLAGMSRSNLYRLLKTGEASLGTFSASGCSRLTRWSEIRRRQSRCRRSPRICASQLAPASAVPSNGSSATARASCGRRRLPGWRHPRRRVAARRRVETSASLFADFSGVTPLAHDRRSADQSNTRTARGRR
jgi:hypothetical protein